MNEQHARVVGAAVAGAAFLGLAKIAVADEPTSIDRWLHDIAVDWEHRGVEAVLMPIEVIGLPGIYIPIAWLSARQLARRGNASGATILGAACVGWLALRGTRLVYRRVRPPRPKHRGPKRESSFPSGHTTGITATSVGAAVALARSGSASRRVVRLLGVGAPLITGINRVYVREHWATDVVGGWLLGGAVALASDAMTMYLTSRAHARRRRRALARGHHAHR